MSISSTRDKHDYPSKRWTHLLVLTPVDQSLLAPVTRLLRAKVTPSSHLNLVSQRRTYRGYRGPCNTLPLMSMNRLRDRIMNILLSVLTILKRGKKELPTRHYIKVEIVVSRTRLRGPINDPFRQLAYIACQGRRAVPLKINFSRASLG